MMDASYHRFFPFLRKRRAKDASEDGMRQTAAQGQQRQANWHASPVIRQPGTEDKLK
jgi:hypothetical protein